MERFPLASDSFEAEEIDAVTAVMRSGRYTMGEQVRAFETEIAAWTGAKHALMVNSGSSANLLMVEALLRRTVDAGQLQAGDEVLVPALAWPTTVWPLVQLGLVPIFVDVDPVTLAIDTRSAANALSPRTKALFLIHVLGLAADMGAMQTFVKQHGLVLLEDCCESFGAFYQGRHVGLFGQAGSLSHFFSHHLTTMEGGTVLTDDPQLLDDLRSFRAHGWARDRSDRQRWVDDNPHLDPRFLFVSTGYNVRPMELQAAVGRVQLRKAEQFLAKREQLARRVWEACRDSSVVRLIGAEFLPAQADAAAPTKQRRHSWMNLPFFIEDPGLSRTQVMQHLEAQGVETRPLIAGNLTQHPAWARMKVTQRVPLDTCDATLSRGFMIGCHPGVTPPQVELLSRALESIKELR